MKGQTFNPIAADVLKALGDPRRLAVLLLIMHQPTTLEELNEQFGFMTARNILYPLKSAGLIVGKERDRPYRTGRIVRFENDTLYIDAQDVEIVIKPKK